MILATVTNADAMSAAAGDLGVNGTLMIIGAVPTLQVASLQLLTFRQSVKGWYSGMAIDSQDTLAFSVLSGVGNERNLSDRAGHRSVRTNDEWQGAISGSDDDRELGSCQWKLSFVSQANGPVKDLCDFSPRDLGLRFISCSAFVPVLSGILSLTDHFFPLDESGRIHY